MTLSVTLREDGLVFGDRFRVRFERTLRIPDDGRTYPLPPSLGAFPVRRVDDYAERVPEAWRTHGGVFLPMHPREAMWLSFHGETTALKVAVGKVCAITGERFDESLSADQNYVVAPLQPWLDGICVKKGVIRQFVAMPLGLGASVEGQVTGEETVGGIQLLAFAPRPGFIAPMWRAPRIPSPMAAPSPAPCAPVAGGAPTMARARSAPVQMGLGAGGTMGQVIHRDPHPMHAWDTENTGRCFVHLVSAEDFAFITGEPAPESPVDAAAYAKAGLPFYALDEHGAQAVSGTEVLGKVKSVQALVPSEQDVSFEPQSVKLLPHEKKHGVRDGLW